ncbi:g3708 [Coccomyxa elongata]
MPAAANEASVVSIIRLIKQLASIRHSSGAAVDQLTRGSANKGHANKGPANKHPAPAEEQPHKKKLVRLYPKEDAEGDGEEDMEDSSGTEDED